MALPNMIQRTNAETLIDEQLSREILQMVPEQSAFLRLARRLPNMTSKQLRIPVLSGMPTAKFLAGDTAKKPTSNMSWDKVYITAEELAVLIPIPEAVLDDASYDIWGEVRPRLVEAFGKAIDAAAFFGVNAPSSWPTGIVPGATAASKVVNWDPAQTDLYQAICGEGGVIAMVEEQGLESNGFVGALPLRAKLRGAVDANKQPIFRPAYSNGNATPFRYELDGQPLTFPKNGAWDNDEALLLTGDFNYAAYAIRQDITYRIFDQGTITDAEGKVALSAMEQDSVILRAVMRLGWALPRPISPVTGNMTYYPFAVLKEQE